MTVKTVRLGDVVERIRNGLSIRQSDDAGGLPITRIETISTGSVNGEKVGFAGLQPGDRDEWLLQAGDILVSHINSMKHLGKCAIYEGEPHQLIHGMNLLSVRSHPDRIFPKYLFRVLSSPVVKRQIPRIARQSVNQSSFGIRAFSGIKIPLPPLPEQRRIAAILDKADAVRRKRQQTLDLADQFLHSAFLDLFGDPVINPKGWPVKKLRGVSDLITDGEHLTPKRTERGVKLLSARNIKDGFVDLEEKVDHISPQEYERLRRRVDPTKGDLLISCSGTIGRVAVLELDEGLALVRSVALVRLKSADMIPQFGAFMLRTPYVQAHMRRGSKASSQANLFQGEIAKLPMLVPPLEVQEKFATLAAQWRTCAEKHQLALVAASTLLASLTQSAFRGDL